MIDRSRPFLLLTTDALLKAAAASAIVFALLLVAWLLCHIVGGIGFGLCMIWILLVGVFFFGIALLPVAIGILIGVGVTEDAKKKGGGYEGAPFIGLVIGVIITANCISWANSNFVPVRISVLNDAKYAWKECSLLGDSVIKEYFIGYQIYIWAWSILVAALLGATGLLLAIGFARGDAYMELFFRKIRYKCPSCGRENPLFRCDNSTCNENHGDLRPTRYGIWKAACGRCGNLLGTTAISGRNNLEKVCSWCSRDLKHPDLGKLSEFHFAVVGAKNSGKTHLLVTAVQYLQEIFADHQDLKITFADPGEERDFQDRLSQLKTGKRLRQTDRSDRPAAFTISIRTADGNGCLLYLYDAAGEDIQAGDTQAGAGIRGHEFHGYIDGIIFVVDPFAEDGWMQQVLQHSGGRMPAGINPAPKDAHYILSRMMPYWERTQRVNADKEIQIPVAVVVTKADAGGLAERLPFATMRSTYSDFTTAAMHACRHSNDVRHFLLAIGSGDFVSNLESRFPEARFFAVSSLGRPDDSSSNAPFHSKGAFAPLQAWLLHRAHALSDDSSMRRSMTFFQSYARRCLRGLEGTRNQVSAWSVIVALAASTVFLLSLLEWIGLIIGILGFGALVTLYFMSFRENDERR